MELVYPAGKSFSTFPWVNIYNLCSLTSLLKLGLRCCVFLAVFSHGAVAAAGVCDGLRLGRLGMA